jgi:uncharacterized protein (DUF1684 family)
LLQRDPSLGWISTDDLRNAMQRLPDVTMILAEGVRFELTRPFGLPVFKTGAINRSATPPETW